MFQLSFWGVECGAETFNYQMAFNENNPGEGLSFGGGSSTPGHVVATGLPMPMTNWIYLVGTFDGSNFRFYTCIQDSMLPGQPQRFYRLALTNCSLTP